MSDARTVKVWPLVEGLRGIDLHYRPVDLPPGRIGRMGYEQAKQLEAEGKLQVAVGISTAELREPQAAAQAPEDLDSVLDEEAEGPVEVKPKPKPRVPRKKTASRRYSRRDITAEKP